MKIIYKKGDVLQCTESHLVHGCNALGIMGAGVAKLIRNDCHQLFDEYRRWCQSGKRLGDILWHTCTNATKLKGKLVGNAVTQQNIGGKRDVSYTAVRKVMRKINEACEEFTNPLPVAMPKIGAGLAGGDWDTIAQIIEEESTNFQPVVYEY